MTVADQPILHGFSETSAPSAYLVVTDPDGVRRVVALRTDGAVTELAQLPSSDWGFGALASGMTRSDGSPRLVIGGGPGESTGGLLFIDPANGEVARSDDVARLSNQDVGFTRSSPAAPPLVLTVAAAVSEDGGVVAGGWSSDDQSLASLTRVWDAPSAEASLGLTVATSAGLWSAVTGDGLPWPTEAGLNFQGGELDTETGAALLQRGNLSISLRRLDDGRPVWTSEAADGYRIAAGDVDGDGAPEVCAWVGGRVTILDQGGRTVWQGPEYSRGNRGGSCTLADLNGDGAFEVIDFTSDGLVVYDGGSGAELWSDRSIAAFESDSGAAVGLLDDALGTAIIVVGVAPDESGELAHLVRVYVGDDEPWAPTRSFWPGPNYAWRDFRDDNTVSWLAHANYPRAQSFRAQPALVGDLPDLTPVVVDQTSEGDLRRLVVAIANRGTVDSEPGATVTARTLIDSAWVDVASARVEDPVPVGWMSGGVRLDLPVEALGDSLIVEVTPANTAFECNPDDDAVVVDDAR